MPGRVANKVAFVTGAARGQGRSHAIRLAQEGADIIALDLCGQVDSVPYGMATQDDMQATVKEIEALDRRVVAAQADVREIESVLAAVDDGVAQLGRVDIVVANAGIASYGVAWELPEQTWRDVIDINLTGVWHAAKAAVPTMIRQGDGGSIVLTSSTAGLMAYQNMAHYTSAKHGVIGLMRTLALELAPHSIRVNTVNPTSVDTDMVHNAATYALFAPDLDEKARTRDAMGARFQELNALPIPWVDAVDISNAVLFLASDEARYVTGVALPVDAGSVIK